MGWCASAEVLRACSPTIQPPQKLLQSTVPLDTAAEDNIRKVCELFDADGAYDEQLAGKMLDGSRSDDHEQAYLPNILVRSRDAAHGVRRTHS